MSSNAIAAVIMLSNATGMHRLLLMSMADEADAYGYFQASPMLARKANITDEQLAAYIEEMVAEGHLLRTAPPNDDRGEGLFYRLAVVAPMP